MPVCRYCGQKAGWFSDAHVVCMNSAQQGANELHQQWRLPSLTS